MAKKDLKRSSYDITEDIWWYEEMKGIEIHIESRDHDGDTVIPHRSVIIPWAQLRAALERKDKQ